jgi:PPOX class probable F420-dependent enzyme
MTTVPESHRDLMEEGARAHAYLATLIPDGSPQVTPVWFDAQGDYLLISSARGRTKDRNMRARPAVALRIADPSDPLRYMQIRGRITDISEDGALEHISRLSMKYRSRPWTPVDGQIRVTYRLLPDHVSTA